LINKFPKVKCFYSFKAGSEKYELFEAKEKIINAFYDLLDKLEARSETILCLRGESKKSPEVHSDFFENELNKVFTVGEKSRYHFNDGFKSIYENTYIECKEKLKVELKELIRDAKDALNKREKEQEKEKEKEALNYFDKLNLDEMDNNSLLKQKLFFLSLFHTDGRLKEFKCYSPFLSVTYGSNKFAIARKFALGGESEKGKAFIYLYSLNEKDPYYMKTSDLSKELSRIGAKWHHDKYNEIKLINGMFPHYILGIFEVERKRTPKFIISPFLYDCLNEEKSFDYVNGLEIDQENFKEYAKGLGYEKYFHLKESGEIYNDSLGNTNPKIVIRP